MRSGVAAEQEMPGPVTGALPRALALGSLVRLAITLFSSFGGGG